jgi:hypothetical protein
LSRKGGCHGKEVANALRIVTLLLAASVSAAQAQNNVRIVIEPATNGLSCGKWTNTPKNSAQHEIFKKWVLGFVFGMNFENTSGDFLQGRDSDGLTAWIDNYCRSNPLHGITQAVIELVTVLRAGR